MKSFAISSLVLFYTFMLSINAFADTSAKIATVIADDLRTADEKARDETRKPAETLAFFGLEKDMAVTELFPGGGWYTKILAGVLKEEGELTVALGLRFLKDNPEKWGYTHVKRDGDSYKLVDTKRSGIFDLEGPGLSVSNQDMVLTFRNAHNLTPQARKTLNASVFEALKPGGIYGVVDHTRRHMEPDSKERWRRVDPVQIIKEALEAGFEFVDYSDLHHQPTDALTHDTRHKSVKPDSDRFTLKFRKPQ